jgi:hypothetical protein
MTGHTRTYPVTEPLRQLFADHYWDSFQEDKDIIMKHIEFVLLQWAASQGAFAGSDIASDERDISGSPENQRSEPGKAGVDGSIPSRSTIIQRREIPYGYVLMPLEATRVMTMAGCDSLPSCEHVFGHAGEILRNAYRKMVEVCGNAPQPASVAQQAVGCGDDEDRMEKISALISRLQAVLDRFGDTCVYIRRGGLSWGAVALNRQDDDKSHGVFDLQAQHDRDMEQRVGQVERLIADKNRWTERTMTAEGRLADAQRIIAEYQAGTIAAARAEVVPTACPPANGLPTLDEYRNNLIEECARMADGWLAAHGQNEIQYTSAREYACDAVADIADAIRGLVLSSTEGK